MKKNSFDKNMAIIYKQDPFKAWFYKHEDKIKKVIFFPFYMANIIAEKRQEMWRKNFEYSPAMAKTILDTYLPHHVQGWLCNDGSFVMCRNVGQYRGELDFWCLDSKMSKKDKCYYWEFVNQIEDYFMDEYEIEGYTKYHSDTDPMFKELAGIDVCDNKKAVFFKKNK